MADRVEELIEELKHTSVERKIKAAEALGEIGDARAVEPLIASLRGSDGDVREAAMKAANRIENLQGSLIESYPHLLCTRCYPED